MLPKLNLVSAIAALVCFFLPWIDIECSGEKMATQTGVQVITGTATPTRAAEAKGIRIGGDDESLGNSYLAAFAFFGVISAAVMGFAAIVSGRRELSRASALLCMGAFLCLAVQVSMGFPAETTMERKLAAKGPKDRAQASPLDELGREVAKEVAGQVRVLPAGWFYLELAALGVPPLLGLGAALGGRKPAAV